MQIQIKLLSPLATLPQYASIGSAGLDLCSASEENIIIPPMQRAIVPMGICIALPQGYEAQVRPRSGLAAKHGITVLNSPGTIDSDYRGEIKVILANLGSEDFVISLGMRIAQLVLAKYEQIEWQTVSTLEETDRGTGGIGSTGLF